MSTSTAKGIVQDVLDHAGITINGTNPWDIVVHDERFYPRVLSQYDLGLGESYMEDWWDCERLDDFFTRVFNQKLDEYTVMHWRFLPTLIRNRWLHLKNTFVNYQQHKHAGIVGKKHYDKGNDLFAAMLDSRMNYSCGYWQNAETLEEAQFNKLRLTCEKLQLKPGMRVLDLGCGWGAFSKFAAEHYGVAVVGITISKEQQKLAQERCAGLPVEIRFQDYREIDEPFDRICSIGMFEHVGHKNYREYFEVANKCLPPEGLFLLHTIGRNITATSADRWTSKYIFPYGMIPSIAQIGQGYEGLLIMEDWHCFGADYDKTLMAWHHNFNQHWDELKNNYDHTFQRMWNYYLLLCAGAFRARDLQLWQVVFSKTGIPGGYKRIT